MRPMSSIESRITVFMDTVSPEPMSGCWLWIGYCMNAGYGTFRLRGINEKAHRASWLMFRGEIPDNLFVCHHCDIKTCVNPDHLFLGTHMDNMRDMMRKGRSPRSVGERAGKSKLTSNQVLEIRRVHRRGLAGKLAKEYGVTKQNIQNIVDRKIWRHI